MDAETAAPEAQGAAGAEAQGATDTTKADAQGAAPAEPATVEILQRKITDLEKDNRSYRQAAKQRDDADKATSLASMDEAERLRAENAELREANAGLVRTSQEQSLRLASAAAAQRLGFRNPDLAHRLIDAAAVEYGEDGAPRNIEPMLVALAKSDPYLLTQTDFGGGQRGVSVAQASDMNALIRKSVGR